MHAHTRAVSTHARVCDIIFLSTCISSYRYYSTQYDICTGKLTCMNRVYVTANLSYSKLVPMNTDTVAFNFMYHSTGTRLPVPYWTTVCFSYSTVDYPYR